MGILVNPELLPRNCGETAVVLKEMDSANDTSFLQEVSIHYAFRKHRNFVKLIGYCVSPKTIVLRYYSLGSLDNLIFNGDHALAIKIQYDFHLAFSLAVDISSGLSYMHSSGYVHCDMKPLNILLDKDENGQLYALLTDFGITRVLFEAEVVSEFVVSKDRGLSPQYAAPEAWKSMNQRQQRMGRSDLKYVDVYAFGIILYELVGRKRAWTGRPIADIKIAVLAGERPDIHSLTFPMQTHEIWVDFKLAILRSWEKDITKRPTMNDLATLMVSIQKVVKSWV